MFSVVAKSPGRLPEQQIVIELEEEGKNGSSIWSGDSVFLKTNTERYLEVQGPLVWAHWSQSGNPWQRFTIEKELNDGAIWSSDVVYFRAHTGNLIDVEGTMVRARFKDPCAKSGFSIAKDPKKSDQADPLIDEADPDLLANLTVGRSPPEEFQRAAIERARDQQEAVRKQLERERKRAAKLKQKFGYYYWPTGMGSPKESEDRKSVV